MEPGSQDADRTSEPITRYKLTPREVEVLRLVAKGLSDAEVAEQLVISPRTVSKHLQSIYGKIEVNSRSAATRFALDQQIV
jgi:DNA-binding NarL/FixJ family response regulator